MKNFETIISTNKDKWRPYVSRKFCWFVESAQIRANSASEQNKYLGLSLNIDNYLILDGDEYYLPEEEDRIYSLLEDKFEADFCFFEKLANKLIELTDDIRQYEAKLFRTTFTNVNELPEQLEEFYEKYSISMISAWSRPDAYLERKLLLLLQEETGLTGDKLTELFEVIATYPNVEGRDLAYVSEPLDLLKIAKTIRDQGLDLDNLPKKIEIALANHAQMYSWLRGPVQREEVKFTETDYVLRLRELVQKDVDKEIAHILKVREQNVADYQAVIDSHRFSDKLLKIAEAMRTFIFMRTYTTEMSDHLFFVGRNTILDSVAEKLVLTNEDVVMLSPSEINSALKKQISNLKEIVAERNKGFAILWQAGKVECLRGDEALYLKNIFSKATGNELLTDSAIKGSTASQGRVTGVVKVLRNYEDIHKVKQGDIIVATMTTPDYVMAMELAAAFVTDEGGVTCHAAIVAREFGVPCVVGTGNATKLLEDGDIVEVDASRGTVNILSGRCSSSMHPRCKDRDRAIGIPAKTSGQGE